MKQNHLLLILSLFTALLFWQPTLAFAATDTSSPLYSTECATQADLDKFIANPVTDQSKNSPDKGKFVQKLIPCIEAPMRLATVSMLQAMSDYLKPVVVILATLAIVFFGIRVMSGEAEMGEAFIFLLRLGMVALFSFNLGGFAQALFDIFDELLRMVYLPDSSGVVTNPWIGIDGFISKIIGFSKEENHQELKNGLLGLLGGSMYSKVFGIMLAIIGSMTLMALFAFIFEATYSYLSSVLSIAFLIIVSPLIIPLAFFQYGDRYVKTWLNMLIYAMVSPIMLFAFLSIFMSLFNDIVDQVFTLLDPDYLAKYLHHNQPLHQAPSISADSGAAASVAKTSGGTLANIPPPSRNYSIDGHAQNTGVGTHDVVDLEGMSGKDGVAKTDLENKKGLFYALFNLWIFTFMMKQLVSLVPRVAASISDVEDSNGTMTGFMNSPFAVLTEKALPQYLRK